MFEFYSSLVLLAILLSLSNSLTLPKENDCTVTHHTAEEIPHETNSGIGECGGLDNIVCNGTGFQSVPDNFSNPGCLTIKFSNIPCIGCIGSIVYKGLRKLFMEANEARFIMDGAFNKLENLETLVLSENHIGGLGAQTFSGLQKLDLLTLNDNDLFQIKSDVFTGETIPNLSILELRNCKISYIENGSFSAMEKLRQLDLSNNAIKQLPVFATSNGALKSLQILHLSSNQISELKGEFFANMVNLTTLYLDNNLITWLSLESFKFLSKSLTSLHLRNNQLTQVDSASICPFSMENFDIALNKISILDSKCITNLSLIHDNPWNCEDCTNSWMVNGARVNPKNYDDPNTMRCDSPESRSGQIIIGRDRTDDIFNPCFPSGTNKAAAISVIVILVLASILVAIFVIIVRRRARRRSQLSQPSNGTRQHCVRNDGVFSYRGMDDKEQLSIDD